MPSSCVHFSSNFKPHESNVHGVNVAHHGGDWETATPHWQNDAPGNLWAHEVVDTTHRTEQPNDSVQWTRQPVDSARQTDDADAWMYDQGPWEEGLREEPQAPTKPTGGPTHDTSNWTEPGGDWTESQGEWTESQGEWTECTTWGGRESYSKATEPPPSYTHLGGGESTYDDAGHYEHAGFRDADQHAARPAFRAPMVLDKKPVLCHFFEAGNCGYVCRLFDRMHINS